MQHPQQTVAKPIECTGIGLHSGQDVHLKILPSAEDTGIVFIRSDLKENNVIPASYDSVVDTRMCTVVANASGAKVGTIEHLMSALWGCGIDNAIIEVDADEMPVMDGSSAVFAALINNTGVKAQSKSRKILEIKKPVTIDDNGKKIELHPADGFEIDSEIQYSHPTIGNQSHVFKEDDVSYQHEISRARTFGFVHEVDMLRQMGLAQGASLDNAVGIGDAGVMNPEGLRYADEFVRHKTLDCIGDLFLAGYRIKGKVKAFKSGHALNNQILRKLFEQVDAYEILEFSDAQAAAL